jgi:hypothetical protein
LETRVGETEALEAKLQKQKDRVEKLKEILEEWKVGQCLKPTELVRVITSQVEAQEQTAARETAETQSTDAQVQITTLEQKIIELQAQLSATSKPEVSFFVCSLPPICPLIYIR